MKKIKLIAIAVAALLCGNTMAADPWFTLNTQISTKGLVYASSSTESIVSPMSEANIFYAAAKNTTNLVDGKVIAYRLSVIFSIDDPASMRLVAGNNNNKTITYKLYSIKPAHYALAKESNLTGKSISATYLATENQEAKALFADEGITDNDASRQKLLCYDNAVGGSVLLYTSESYTTSRSAITNIPIYSDDLKSEQLAEGTYILYIDCGSTSGNTVDSIVFTPLAQDPKVKSYTTAGVEATIDQENKTITAELPFGTNITADTYDTAKVVLGGSAVSYNYGEEYATLIVSDGKETNVTYTLSISAKQTASDDATLKSLSVNGTALAGFSADNLNYTYEIGYDDALPVVTAETNDATADMVITDATEVPGDATVVVTAQNGTTVKTYTISFTRADALRELKQVILSNGMKANIYNSAKIVKGGYVGDAPTISSCVVDDGATWKMEGNDLVVTGLDGVSDTYSVELVAYTPYEAKSKSDAVTFDTTAVDGAYIHTIYGWDNSKGVKWSKPIDESGNMRIREGKNRVYFFFAACDSIDFIGSSAGARDVEVTINGVVYSQVTKTPAKDAYIRINVGGEAAMIGFESNGGTNGDSGFASMIVYNDKFTPTSLKSAIMSGKAVKFMRNGAMYIRRGNDIFNALGKQVKF